ncbi:MAG: carboxymuconolactone decarboxylase family protein [Parvularculaceae bacterium]
MTFIKTISQSDAEGRLKSLYDRVKGPDGRVDNILLAHSLRPHTLEGHMALYKSVLHHSSNRSPKWYLEAVGVYVSLLNGCAYCVDHHFAGLARALGDDDKASAIRAALEAGLQGDVAPGGALDDREVTGLDYAGKLTRAPSSVCEADIDALRKAGFNDGEILEINQVAAYFAYANRTVLGLGCSTDGEALGHSPNGAEDDDWGHQ